MAAPATAAPVPVISLTGTDLDAAKMDADLAFPARLKQSLTGWRVGATAMIDGREVQVLQEPPPVAILRWVILRQGDGPAGAAVALHRIASRAEPSND